MESLAKNIFAQSDRLERFSSSDSGQPIPATAPVPEKVLKVLLTLEFRPLIP